MLGGRWAVKGKARRSFPSLWLGSGGIWGYPAIPPCSQVPVMLALGDTGLETCRQPSSSLPPHPATALPSSLLPFGHPWDGKKNKKSKFIGKKKKAIGYIYRGKRLFLPQQGALQPPGVPRRSLPPLLWTHPIHPVPPPPAPSPCSGVVTAGGGHGEGLGGGSPSLRTREAQPRVGGDLHAEAVSSPRGGGERWRAFQAMDGGGEGGQGGAGAVSHMHGV